MIVYFIKIKTHFDKDDIYGKLRGIIEKPTFYINIGFLKEKIIGTIDERKNFFSIRRRTNDENPLISVFYGYYEYKKDDSHNCIKGYFYINPLMLIVFLIIVIYLIRLILFKEINYWYIFFTIAFSSLTIGHGIYRNIKDIKIIKELLIKLSDGEMAKQDIKYKILILIQSTIIIILLTLIFIYF